MLKEVESITLPLIPLRDIVMLPNAAMTIFVARERSIGALNLAVKDYDHHIVLLTQKDGEKDSPKRSDLYSVGCVAKIAQMMTLPDENIKILVQGVQRIQVPEIEITDKSYFTVDGRLIATTLLSSERKESAMRRLLLSQVSQYADHYSKPPKEILDRLEGIQSLEEIVDILAHYIPLKIQQKQEILATVSLQSRIEKLVAFLEQEIDIASLEKRIRARVKNQLDKNQRDYHLNEQIKAIQKELNDGEDSNEIDKLQERIDKAGMPAQAKEKALNELRKLKTMPSASSEASVVRGYLDTLLSVPWKTKTRTTIAIDKAIQILDEDHYGLEKVKERIIEYLAVQKRVGTLKAPILCLVGPPGVGKTSLGESIAKATNRKYTRIALGGVDDEAEIRGHRRTYIGAMVGKIISGMIRVGVKNPFFLLDEIDKMGSSYRGTPADALLEVLDPEQNKAFQDHYLEVDYDLSEVMFVATSNSYNIPLALLDRMEIIRLSGYTEDEKVNIAIQHLLPKLMKNNGVKETELAVHEDAIRTIIRHYTSEAGVRNLERELGRICRKVVTQALKAKRQKVAKVDLHSQDVATYLGVPKYDYGVTAEEPRVGFVNGLAWTSVGGDLLHIEAAIMPGKGVLQVTGSLGDVMKESMRAALTVVRGQSELLQVPVKTFEKSDIHIHAPEGATPKDGPSAGIAIATALASAFTGIPVRSDLAMTGEITLHGEVLPIGGLKEKLLAALRAGVKTVLIPEKNLKDLPEIPDKVKENLEIIPVRWIHQVLENALLHMPKKSVKKATTDDTLKPVPKGKKVTVTRTRAQA